MDSAQVRALFDANDSRIDSGFWESFRTSSTAGNFAADTMTSQVSADGSNAAVQVFSGGKSVTIKMHREGGAWKVGWMETFFPQRR
jgi:hypothetical protein